MSSSGVMFVAADCIFKDIYIYPFMMHASCFYLDFEFI